VAGSARAQPRGRRMSAVRAAIGPGRWHFQHGPIDLVIEAAGRADALAASLEHAWARFAGVLVELVGELPRLRAPIGAGHCELEGPIARRMWAACAPFCAAFVTPMAAVAGAVAQEIAASFARDGVQRACVNNGGDIALHLADDACARIAVCTDPTPGRAWVPDARLVVDAASPVRGVATSGWRGRSLSMGIADAVTVLAPTAAQADAAATMIANAVDCDDPAIVRRPASSVRQDTDLGVRLVTVAVGQMSARSVERALDRGEAFARETLGRGLAVSALLSLQGRSRIVDSR